MNKKALTTGIVFIVITILVYIGFVFFKRNQILNVNEPDKKEVIIPARPKTTDEGIVAFDNACRVAFFAAEKNDIELAKDANGKAVAVWRDLINEFINTPEKKYAKHENWQEDLLSIFELSKKAEESLATSPINESIKNLEEARQIVFNITENDEIYIVENALFSLYKKSKDVYLASNLNEAQEKISDFKLEYTKVKDLARNKTDKQNFVTFEKSLIELEGASETTLIKNQTIFREGFFEFFEKFN